MKHFHRFVQEAMICDKAVITTANNGNEDIIENNETGILVESKNVNELVEKIKMLYENENLRLELGRLPYHLQDLFVFQQVFQAYSIEGTAFALNYRHSGSSLIDLNPIYTTSIGCQLVIIVV